MPGRRDCGWIATMATEARPCRVDKARVAGLNAVVLHDDAAELHATWVPAAGMLGASLVHRGREMLWRGDGVAAYAGRRAFMVGSDAALDWVQLPGASGKAAFRITCTLGV
jgi:hypothetical protein